MQMNSCAIHRSRKVCPIHGLSGSTVYNDIYYTDVTNRIIVYAQGEYTLNHTIQFLKYYSCTYICIHIYAYKLYAFTSLMCTEMPRPARHITVLLRVEMNTKFSYFEWTNSKWTNSQTTFCTALPSQSSIIVRNLKNFHTSESFGHWLIFMYGYCSTMYSMQFKVHIFKAVTC